MMSVFIEESCRERKLFDAFDKIRTHSKEEKSWYSRRDRQSDRSQQLWVGQTWILFAGTSELMQLHLLKEVIY